MPLLARSVQAPLHIDVRRGAVSRPGPDPRRRPDLGRRGRRGGGRPRPGRADRRDDPAVARTRRTSTPPPAAPWTPRSSWPRSCAPGRTTRWSASAAAPRSTPRSTRPTAGRMPMVSVATSLANDGIASPVASLINDGIKGSYGVHIPFAVIVDLDFVENGPDRVNRGGIGDVISNISALADWELAREVRGEPVDGLAASLARMGAEAVLNHARRHERRRVRHGAGRGADLQRPGDGGVRQQPADQRRLPRDHARHRLALPGHRARTASWPGWARCSARSCAATSAGSPRWPTACARHQLPTHAGRRRPGRRPVRRRWWSSRRGPGRTATRSSSTSR